jgi:hypothetical protein
MKVVHYIANQQESSVERAVLLSPPDFVGIMRSNYGPRLDSDLELAKNLVDRTPNALMPSDAYFDPIGAASYLSYLNDLRKTGMFTFSDLPLMRESSWPRVSCPIFVSFCTEGEAVISPIDACVAALNETKKNSTKLLTEIFSGANHSYHGFEDKLAASVAEWLGGSS